MPKKIFCFKECRQNVRCNSGKKAALCCSCFWTELSLLFYSLGKLLWTPSPSWKAPPLPLGLTITPLRRHNAWTPCQPPLGFSACRLALSVKGNALTDKKASLKNSQNIGGGWMENIQNSDSIGTALEKLKNWATLCNNALNFISITNKQMLNQDDTDF